MKKLLVVSLSLGTLLMTACRKEKLKSTQDKIQGKWKFVSVTSTTVDGNGTNTGTYNGTDNDYSDFRQDGKVYEFLGGDYDTTAYKVLNDQYISIGIIDSFKINTLTETNLSLYHKGTIPGGTAEQTVNFKK